MTVRAYAGIGSRKTPADVLELMRALAVRMAAENWTLRSGHAPGADQAFEAGAGALAEIYLPWPTFCAETVPHPDSRVQARPADGAYAIAAEHHPAWGHLGRGPQALHARNVHQILGADLASPVRAVICWTPDGTLNGQGGRSGGTGGAIRIAHAHGIDVRNLARPDHQADVRRLLGLAEPSDDQPGLF